MKELLRCLILVASATVLLSGSAFTKEQHKEDSLISLAIITPITQDQYPRLIWQTDPKAPEDKLIADPISALATSAGIAVFERSERQLWLLSIDGGQGIRCGRQGQGPGEYIMPQPIQIREDGSVLVWDRMLPRITHFTATGEFINSAGLSSSGRLFYQGTDGTNLIFAREVRGDPLTLWSKLLRVSYPEGNIKAEGDSLVIQRFLPNEGRGYRANTAWGGERFFYSSYHDTSWYWFPEKCELTGFDFETARRTNNRLHLRSDDVRSEYRVGCGSRSPDENQDQNLYRTIKIDSEGYFWLEHSRTPPGEEKVDVFGPDGIYVGTALLPSRLNGLSFLPRDGVVGIGPQEVDVIGVTQSEEGYNVVARWRLLRPAR